MKNKQKKHTKIIENKPNFKHAFKKTLSETHLKHLSNSLSKPLKFHLHSPTSSRKHTQALISQGSINAHDHSGTKSRKPSRDRRSVGQAFMTCNISPNGKKRKSSLFKNESKLVGRNNYRFVNQIGLGGFGKVWRVIDKEDNKQYVIKQISKRRYEGNNIEQYNLKYNNQQ